ncbi:MAG: SPOR domain-containing protein [Cyanobacteria bacterium HKST-UBA06]|nr:SPOR domain-containing protein [Cyanobacteria bacterium HKST-UBA05]MCA9798488.1 SPOR domain-containing protein [Cyanobacteria bacterium HKST-UBA04]MCA9807830.1 SPOR domain-containing protein [Cyanobacteria bacterium HKST-UBA06]MCA9842832.1 SPOR domain-containing protein [Cyanobacteria bacterium HKST-UBA03]
MKRSAVIVIFLVSMTATLMVMVVGYALFFKDDQQVVNNQQVQEISSQGDPAEPDTVPWLEEPQPIESVGEPVDMNLPEAQKTDDPAAEQDEASNANGKDLQTPYGQDTPIFPDAVPPPADPKSNPVPLPELIPGGHAPMPAEPEGPPYVDNPSPSPASGKQGAASAKSSLYYVVLSGFASQQAAEDALVRIQDKQLNAPAFIRVMGSRVVLQFGVFSERANAEQMAQQLRQKGINVTVQ